MASTTAYCRNTALPPPHELMLMCAATLWLRPKLIVEWGTGIGVSSRFFHEANIHYNIGGEIHSIDLPDHISHVEHPSSRRGILVRGLPMYLHQGDGATIASSLLKNKDVHTPLIFIDGDHAKDSVLRDCRTILNVAPKVGLLLHDTFYQPKSNYNHGPYEAIQELLKDLGESVQIIEFGLGCPGMTFLLPL